MKAAIMCKDTLRIIEKSFKILQKILLKNQFKFGKERREILDLFFLEIENFNEGIHSLNIEGRDQVNTVNFLRWEYNPENNHKFFKISHQFNYQFNSEWLQDILIGDLMLLKPVNFNILDQIELD